MCPLPCSRRAALKTIGAGGLAVAAVPLAACGPEDQGWTEEIDAASGSVALDALPENSVTMVDFGDTFAAVVRGTGEDVHAFAGYCTHHQCALEPEGPELSCPCHGSRFETAAGEVLRGPAEVPLPDVPVAVTGGRVSLA